MFRGVYERLPMYASSESTSRLRSSSSVSSSSSPRSSSSPYTSSFSHNDIYTPTYSPISPTRRRSHSSPNAKHFFHVPPRSLITLVKLALPLSLAAVLIGFVLYEPHLELAFYSRQWIHSEIDPIFPLAGCFDPSRVSAKYNLSDVFYGKKTYEVQAGMPLRMGLDCYDFAGTIQGIGGEVERQRTLFHTYWRTDLVPFGRRQEWMLKSFFATQDLAHSRLILWSNGDLSSNEILGEYLNRFPEAFALRVVNIAELAVGTALEGNDMLMRKDTKAWVDGDLIRLLLLWTHGGVWVDMDSLFTRDLEPLLEHEFVSQWDCYDKIYQPLNGAIMHFRQQSPYLCEAFHIMVSSKPPRAGSTDWGSLLYFKLWRRLVAASIPPFKVLPFCFTDGRSCRLDNRLPDPFVPDNSKGRWTLGLGLEEGGGLDRALGKVFGVHLHNQWEKQFPPGGWVERLLLAKYEQKLSLGERSGWNGTE